MADIIYFSVNNWFSGRDYPKIEVIADCIHHHKFENDEWCKENKLCVCWGYIDMSVNYCISAPRVWVETNCPKLLSDDQYSYNIITSSKDGTYTNEYIKKYKQFVYSPDEDGYVEDKFGWRFLEYSEENFGSHFVEYDNDYFDEENE